MRKILLILMCLMISFCCAFGFIACNNHGSTDGENNEGSGGNESVLPDDPITDGELETPKDDDEENETELETKPQPPIVDDDTGIIESDNGLDTKPQAPIV